MLFARPPIHIFRARISSYSTASYMSTKPKLNVHSFPRPPRLEKTPRHLRVTWNGETVADTSEAYWVLETTHPPTYYLPPAAFSGDFKLSKTTGSSYCEWKGKATYWALTHPNSKNSVKGKIWSYEEPTPGFKDIKGYLSLYADSGEKENGWECWVDDEKVQPQPGDFYGGWMTSDIEGPVKGGPGTWGW